MHRSRAPFSARLKAICLAAGKGLGVDVSDYDPWAPQKATPEYLIPEWEGARPTDGDGGRLPLLWKDNERWNFAVCIGAGATIHLKLQEQGQACRKACRSL